VAPQLRPEDLVTLRVLKQRGQSNCRIAQTLGVSEGAIRYHLRRADWPDARQNKPHKVDYLAQAIDHWLRSQQPDLPSDEVPRPSNVHALHDWLRQEFGYDGSYKSVLRFVRAHYPKPRRRPYRRVETPPGAQAQVDWGTCSGIDIGDGPQDLYAFVLVLSHSRKETVIWETRMDQLSWHHAHNQALRRLGGVPAVLRIDNLKTGIAQGAGPWGEINPAYLAYAKAAGFHVDACLPHSPEHKGKVENKVGFVKRRLCLRGYFAGLAELQANTDAQLERSDGRRLCPATGQTVAATFLTERPLLRELPLLPEPFDVIVTRPVQKDCTVNFESRAYSVPFQLCGARVEVRGCASVVQIWHEGCVWAEHPRHTAKRLLLDARHYEGESTPEVMAPTPLGKMGRRLQEILEMPVEQRPLDLYAALAEVAR
jgi:transposase